MLPFEMFDRTTSRNFSRQGAKNAKKKYIFCFFELSELCVFAGVMSCPIVKSTLSQISNMFS